MTNSNFLKKLLATASVVAVSASASSSFANLKQINAGATITNGGGVGIVDTANPPAGANFNDGDSLSYLGNHTLSTGGVVTVHTIDLNNKNAGVFTVGNDASVSSVINSGGNQKLVTTVGNNRTLTLDKNAGLNASGAVATGGVFTHLGPVTLGGGAGGAKLVVNADTTLSEAIIDDGTNNSTIEINGNVTFDNTIGTGAQAVGTLDVKDNKNATLAKNSNIKVIQIGSGASTIVADDANITSDNIKGSVDDKGSLKFKGKSTVNAQKIGDGTKLNSVELEGAGIVDLANTTDFTATKTTLTHADAVLKFSNAATVKTNIVTVTDKKGKVVLAEDTNYQGSFGENGKSLAEINFSADKTLTIQEDDSKLYVENVTTSGNNGTGKLDIKSANFEIHSNIGAQGKALNSVKISSNAAGAATTVKLMDNKSIHASTVDLSAIGQANVLELYQNSSITGNVITSTPNTGSLSVKGDSKIDGNIGTNAGNAINQIKFDAAKTLEVTKNDMNTNNGIDFAEDGVLKLTEDKDVNINKVVTTKTAATGTGSIVVNSATNGKTIEVTAQIGNVAAANNDDALKLLQARGGADIKLSTANVAIKKIDIESQDSSLILNAAGGDFLINNFSHSDGQGTLKLDENATLKAGTNLSSGAKNTLKSVDLGNNKTLTVEDGVNIYTSSADGNGIKSNTAGSGKLIVQGDSIIAGPVGASNGIGGIDVTGANKTATFHDKVNLVADGGLGTDGKLTISKDATAVLGSEFIGTEIIGAGVGEGTVKFANNVALAGDTKIQSKIGATQLETVEIAGKDITFSDATFDTQNLKFSSNGNTTATFDGFAAGDELRNTTITTTSTTRQHHITLTKGQNQTFDQKVGTEQNKFGNFVLAGDDTITVNEEFYAGVINSKAQEGTVTIAKDGGVALNLGTKDSELKAVNVNENATIYEGVWSKDVAVAAGKTATFKSSISGTNTLNLGNNSVADFTGKNATLDISVTSTNASEGALKFSDGANINKKIGSSGKRIDKVDFVGTDSAAITNINANINADNITVSNQTLRATQNIELNGTTAFNDGSFINLGTNKLTLKNGNARVTGTSGVNVTLNSDKVIGFILVDATGGATNLDTSGATKLLISVDDSIAMLPVTDEEYTLIATANGGTATPIGANVEVNSTGNNFVDWSLTSGGKLVRKNVASTALTNIIGNSDKELLQDALQFVNTDNKGKAAEYASELARMDNNRLKESIARSSEQNSVHAVEIANSLLESTNAAINNRMGAFSNHPQPGVQLASQGVSGVAAGEGDHTMYGAWVSPFYNQTTQKARGSRAGFKSSTYGATLGFDTQANADLTVGVAGTYAKSDVKHKNFKSGDKTKGDTFAFSIYGIQQLTNNWFLQGHAAYATTRMKNSEKRITATTSETARSEFDVTSYNAELLAGFNYSMGEAVVTPLVGASYTRINNSGYTETGTTNQNLTVSSKATNKFDAVVGLRGQMTTEMNGINVTPEIHGFVRHDLIGKDSKTTAKISGMANSLTPKSAKAIKTTFNVGLGVNAVSGMYEYGAGYDLFAANKTIGHQGTLKVRVNF